MFTSVVPGSTCWQIKGHAFLSLEHHDSTAVSVCVMRYDPRLVPIGSLLGSITHAWTIPKAAKVAIAVSVIGVTAGIVIHWRRLGSSKGG